MYQSLGLDITEPFSTLSQARIVDERGGVGDLSMASWSSEAAPVCVLPWTLPEQPLSDYRALRKTWGRSLHAGAGSRTVRRIPAWVVWAALAQEREVSPEWRYADATGHPVRIPLRNICRSLVTAAVSSREEGLAEDLKVVAMPDHFTERAQENLIRSMPWSRGDVRLLWRSVATVLAWTSGFSEEEVAKYNGQRVAVIDVRNSEISTTVLELRAAQGRAFLIPKRDLPENHCFLRTHVLPFDVGVAYQLLKRLGASCEFPEIWQLVIDGDVIHSGLSSGRPVQEGQILLESPGGWQKLRFSPEDLWAALEGAWETASAAAPSVLSDIWPILVESCDGLADIAAENRATHREALTADIPDWLEGLEQHPSLVLLAGELSGSRTSPNVALAQRMAQVLADRGMRAVFFPGYGLPVEGAVAQGCAVYGVREQAGLPTYLDTLPRFHLLGKNQQGRNVEYDLLQLPSADRVVEGGKEYRSGPDDLKNVAKIVRGLHSVPFKLKRESVKKQLEQHFSTAPLEDCLLSFSVRMRPAQGFARVSIIPEIADLFGGKEVVLDWDRMKDYDETEDEFDPGFPLCQPLLAEPSQDPFVRPVIDEYIHAVRRENWREAERELEEVGKTMQSGRACGSFPRGRVIDFLIAAHEVYRLRYDRQGVFERYMKRGEKIALKKIKRLIRAATALYARTPEWATAFLVKEFKRVRTKNRSNPNPTPVFTFAAGRCFSTPEQIELFTECMDARFKNRIDNYLNTPSASGVSMNNWCKALQLILRLNEDAALAITSDTAYSLARSLCLLLEIEPERVRAKKLKARGGVSAPYQHAMLTLYYLLRFRAPEANKDFLTDWQEPDTVANGIRESLLQTDKGRTSWRRIRNVTLEAGESLQSSLVRFLESRATRRDVIIMDSGFSEVVGSSD